MADTWTVAEAKAKFSEVIDRAREQGPQTVTRHGKPVAVVSAIDGMRSCTDNRKVSKALLALLRSCPVDLSRVVTRDRSLMDSSPPSRSIADSRSSPVTPPTSNHLASRS